MDKDIIIDALLDYRRWFTMDADYENDLVVIDRIDGAIEWIEEQTN